MNDDKGAAKSGKVLVTVADDADAEDVAKKLRSEGVEISQVLPLSGIITAEASPEDWGRIQQVPGVLSVEEDQTFTAL